MPVKYSMTIQISLCFINSISLRGTVVLETFRLLFIFDGMFSRKALPRKNTMRVNEIDESSRSKAKCYDPEKFHSQLYAEKFKSGEFVRHFEDFQIFEYLSTSVKKLNITSVL